MLLSSWIDRGLFYVEQPVISFPSLSSYFIKDYVKITVYRVLFIQVHCSEFMQFAEVENLHDFYSVEGRFVHTQDQRGFYVVYDVALQDLEELEKQILLVGSRFIQRNTVKKMRGTEAADVRAGSEVDRVAVLLDLWTCETEFLESKVQVQGQKWGLWIIYFVKYVLYLFNLLFSKAGLVHGSLLFSSSWTVTTRRTSTQQGRRRGFSWLELLPTSCTVGHNWTWTRITWFRPTGPR